MTYRIPRNGALSQPNTGEISGNIYRSQNLDLKTSPGKIKVSPRLVVNTKDNDSGISGMGVPQAFVNHVKSSTHQFYAACGIGDENQDGSGKILVSATDSPTALFSNDASTGSPTNVSAAFSDMVEWTDAKNDGSTLGPSIFVSTFSSSTSQIKKLFNSVWNTTWFTGTAGGSFVSNGGVKNLCVGFNRNLYITDDDKVIYVPFSTTGVAAAAVTSGVGTLNFYGAYRAIWHRSTSTNLFVSLMTYDAGTGSKGYIAVWDTTGTAPQKIIDIAAPCALSGTVIDDIFYIIDAYGRWKKYTGTNFLEVARLPVANQNIEMPGIYNDHTNSRWIHHRGVDNVDGKANISVNNFVSTGVYVEDMPSGVWEYDPNRPELGLYHKESPCADTNDYGQQAIKSAGAIYGTKRSNATFLAGYGYYTDDATTSRNGIFYDDIATNNNKHGLLTTPWLESENIEDVWQKAFYRNTPLPAGDLIIGKARTEKKANLPFVASITWTAANTFTSTDTNFQYASVLDEVEIIMGKGASTTAHILSIPPAVGPTYTVTLEDAIGFTIGTAKAKVNNYRKLGVISAQNSSSQDLPIQQNGARVQVKTEFRVNGNFELDDLTIINQKHQ